MAEFKLGRIKFVWKGAWVPSTIYVKDDIVRYGGKSYVCVVGHTAGGASGGFETDLTASRWSLMNDGQAWNNTWATSTYYKVNDVVRYGGRSYIANAAHTSAATSALGLETDSSKWDIFNDGIAYAGTWSYPTRYKANDVVAYGGQLYICTTHHTSSATFATANFAVFATGLQFEGVYDAGATYQPGDVVVYGANSFVAVQTTTGNLPTNLSFWSPVTQGVQYRSTYDNGTTYRKGDIVAYGGYTYAAKSDSTGNLPTNGTYWDLVNKGYTLIGAYNNGTAYKPGELVTYGGNVYAAKADTTGNLPTSTAQWDIFNKGFNWLGEYAGGTSYAPGDVVKYGARIFLNIQAGSGNLPTNASFWNLLNDGVRSAGTYADITAYLVGDIVRYGGRSYICILGHTSNNATNVEPPNATYWQLLAAGMNWRGNYSAVTEYELDDVVNYAGSSWISIANDNVGNQPDASPSQWALVAQTGNLAPILTTTGDTFRYGASAVERLPIGQEGQMLVVNNGLPRWEDNNETRNVYYVTPEGSNSNDGLSYNRAFASIRYACTQVRGAQFTGSISGTTLTVTLVTSGTLGVGQIVYGTGIAPVRIASFSSGSGLTGTYNLDSARTFSSGSLRSARPATIYVKAGTFTETLPIVVPENVHIIGDGQRVTSVQPASGVSADGSTLNNRSTMFLMSDGSMLSNINMMGMTGFTIGTTPNDITTSTTGGVFVAFNPDSPILTKSPYVTDCSTFSTGGTGAVIDGAVHSSGNRSMLFHAFTNINDNGVGFWVSNAGRAEIVSCFTYYCAFGYAASEGGQIRALNGNCSYGEYGAASVGFDPSETPVTASVYGQELNYLIENGEFVSSEIITGQTSGATARVLINQPSANKLYFKQVTGSFSSGEVITGGSGARATVNAGIGVAGQKGFIVVVSGLTAEPRAGGSISLAGDAVSYVIQSVSEYTAPGTGYKPAGFAIIVLTNEKGTSSAESTAATIRYKYSKVRLTGHDFLSIGTGGLATTNHPNEPSQAASQADEVIEIFPGRVFYVSTDQDGNFRVGEYFRVDQATGTATLNANAFNLAGLSSLRLGSIGAQLGATINEFSTDETLSGASNTAVPTEFAVKTYVDSKGSETYLLNLATSVAFGA